MRMLHTTCAEMPLPDAVLQPLSRRCCLFGAEQVHDGCASRCATTPAKAKMVAGPPVKFKQPLRLCSAPDYGDLQLRLLTLYLFGEELQAAADFRFA